MSTQRSRPRHIYKAIGFSNSVVIPVFWYVMNLRLYEAYELRIKNHCRFDTAYVRVVTTNQETLQCFCALLVN